MPQKALNFAKNSFIFSRSLKANKCYPSHTRNTSTGWIDFPTIGSKIESLNVYICWHSAMSAWSFWTWTFWKVLGIVIKLWTPSEPMSRTSRAIPKRMEWVLSFLQVIGVISLWKIIFRLKRCCISLLVNVSAEEGATRPDTCLLPHPPPPPQVTVKSHVC